jgi:polyhydroxyalkanoate synthase
MAGLAGGGFMKSAIVVHEQTLEVVIHRHRRAQVHVQQLKLPSTGQVPPLAMERTRMSGGHSGPPVILIHGFAQNRFTWQVSGRSLPAYLAMAGFDVYNLELRGHGRSREYGSPSATCFKDYVEDLVAVVQDCEVAPFVMGHSLGAGVGVGACTLTPMAGLIHLAGVYQFGRTNPWLNGLARALLKVEKPLMRLPIRMRTRWVGELIAPLVVGADTAMHVLPFAGWVPGSMEKRLIQERVRKGFDWTNAEIWLDMARLAMGAPFPYKTGFQTVDVPLLVLAGDRDKLLSPEEARACFDDSGSSDKTFRLYEKAIDGMHWGHLDLVLGRYAPEVVWPEILAWMRARG